MKPTMKWFIAAIAAMGVIRFTLNQAGAPDSIVKYFSMTVIMIVGSVYFAIASTTHKERLKAAYLLVLPYMIVESLALGCTWTTGHPTILSHNVRTVLRQSHPKCVVPPRAFRVLVAVSQFGVDFVG